MERHTGKYFNEEKVNELLWTCMELVDDGEEIILQKHSEEHNKAVDRKHSNRSYYDLLEPLIGYGIILETDGDHKSDSQWVEYDFTFISPEGETTTIITEMCLMEGFDYGEDVTIN